jgi:hypothetical protein
VQAGVNRCDPPAGSADPPAIDTYLAFSGRRLRAATRTVIAVRYWSSCFNAGTRWNKFITHLDGDLSSFDAQVAWRFLGAVPGVNLAYEKTKVFNVYATQIAPLAFKNLTPLIGRPCYFCRWHFYMWRQMRS